MTATPTDASVASRPVASATRKTRVRDPRLDFFRGIAMFIIFVAHVPGNFLVLWIPARFGFSDAAEIFVFCSGMASAIAFGASFDRAGWLAGAARVVYRVWQVYWAHIGMFFALLAALSFANSLELTDKDYVRQLNLMHFVNDVPTNIVGLFTLTYVPNYFDILPMYLVILAMIPIVMALSRISLSLTGLAIITTWLAANFGILQLPAEPWSERVWYFNPFGWQLLFFTGFAFMRGWLPAPPVRKELLITAAVIVLISIPFTYFRILGEVPELKELSKELYPFRAKTNEGILRYIHFLSIAYLAWAACGSGGRYLVATGTGLGARFWDRFVKIVQKVGQQSLAVFVFSMVSARLVGVVLDVVGRTGITVVLVNMAGFALLILVANLVAWFKSHPWQKVS